MRVFIDTEIGVISGFTVDPLEQENGAPAPDGYSRENWLEWIVTVNAEGDMEMVHDAEKAALRRNPNGPGDDD